MKQVAALLLLGVLLLGCPAGSVTLTGAWDTSVKIAMSPLVLSLDTSLYVGLLADGWTIYSETIIGRGLWEEQSLIATGSLGPFILIDAGTVFDPLSGAFKSAEVAIGGSYAGVTCDATIFLVPQETFLDVLASGSASNLDVAASVSFGTPGDGMCDFDWQQFTLTAGFPFRCCDWQLGVTFDPTGFGGLSVAVDDIYIPHLVYMVLSATLLYDAQQKTLEVSPHFDFGYMPCLSV